MTERASQVDVFRSQVLAVYGRLVASLDALGATLRGGERPALIGIRRAFQSYARLSSAAQPYLLGLSSLGEHHATAAATQAHVGALTVAMARRAMMPTAIQRDVGVAAAVSSIAKALNPGLAALSVDECVEKGVYAMSARWLAQVPGLDPFKELLVLVAADQADKEARLKGHLVSQMTAVATRYDELAHGVDGNDNRGYRALEALSNTDDVSPAVLRLLELTIGSYPVGTAVRLSTGELAIVVAPNAGTNVDDPTVAIMRERSGQMADGRVMDLAATEVTITDVVDMTQLKLGAGELMLF